MKCEEILSTGFENILIAAFKGNMEVFEVFESSFRGYIYLLYV